MKLLLIEDEVSLHELIVNTLSKDGFIVESAYNVASAIDKLSAYYYDCILLDINLPDGSGLTILEHLKKTSAKTNVIITSARDSLDNKIQGLELGAEITLLKKEFDILKYFLMRPGHMVDKSVLAEAIWGDHIDQTDDFQFVYAQMKNLRKKLSEAGADIEIKSVYGFGYKLIKP